MLIYGLIFFIASGLMYYLIRTNKVNLKTSNEKVFIFTILALGLLIRVIAAPKIEGFSVDISCFKAWASAAAKNLPGFYNTGMFCDYPPLYIYVLFIIGKITGISGMGQYFTLLVKLPSIFADITTAYILYRIARKHLSNQLGILIAAFYVFNPAVIINSTIWGQVDSFFTMIIAGAILFLTYNKLNAAAVLFAASILMKPQGIIFLPIFLFELIKVKDIKKILSAFMYGLAASIIIIVPFSRDPFWIIGLLSKTVSGYTYASLNAFNLFSLFGANLRQDSSTLFIFSYNTWGFIFITLITAFSAFLYWKGKHTGIASLAALIQITGVFVLSSRMHERYMFPSVALSLMAFIFFKDRRLLPLSAGLSATVFVNTYVVLDRMLKYNYPHVPANDAVLLWVSLANVLLLCWLIKLSVDIVIKGRISVINPGSLNASRKRMVRQRTSLTTSGCVPDDDTHNFNYKPDRTDIIIMSLMTAVYLIIALINLGSINVPKTSWKPVKSGENFVIDLGKQVQLSKIYYYCGLGDGWSAGGKYSISYLDSSGKYKSYATIEKKNIFIWKAVTPTQVKTSRLQILVDEPGGALNELGLFENGSSTPLKGVKIVNKSINPGDSGVVENLFDEQDKIDYKHSFMSGMIFDEIYHARTAYEYLHHIEPFEWTHPPLGKLFIAAGIAIFGMDPFGWRIIGTLFGAAMIPVMYLFGKKIFYHRFYAFCAAFLMMFDFMHFSLTRIATIDVYGTFFVILMYFFMYDYFTRKSYNIEFKKSLKPLFWSGLFFGMGAASKWIGLYAGGGLALLFFYQKFAEYWDYKKAASKNSRRNPWVRSFIPLYLNRTILYCILFFIIIPAIIYTLSYIPYMLVPGPGHGLGVVLKNQIDMFRYHSKDVLGATHPFSSYWWEWPIIRKPLETYLATGLPAGMSSSMTIMGNPAIWWIGIPAVPASLILALKKRDKKMFVIFTAMAFQYLPWVGVKRIVFIYHFFSTIPFLILTIVFMIKYLLEKYPQAKYIVYSYLAAVAILFIMFYPVLSGMEVNRFYVEQYLRWFKGVWFF